MVEPATVPPSDSLAPEPRPDEADPYPTRLTESPFAAQNLADAMGWPEVPGYEILGVLGRGGMGVVYKARQVGLGRLVALKMIRASGHAGPEEVARFRREAQAIARLHHPSIVQIYEVGESAGQPFFSLEFVDGGSLDQKLKGTPIPPLRAAELAEMLARAVHAAHLCGVVHRDLKPANVLMAGDGTLKVTDFGLAKRPDASGPQTTSGAIMGTPSYMAPEQAAGKTKEIGPAADVYALGAILYELLTGRPPFKAVTPLDTVLQVISEEPVPPSRLQPNVPRDVETICLKCLEKDRGARYASALELAEDLIRFRQGEPIQGRRASAWARSRKWVTRHPALTTLVASISLQLVVFSWLPIIGKLLGSRGLSWVFWVLTVPLLPLMAVAGAIWVVLNYRLTAPPARSRMTRRSILDAVAGLIVGGLIGFVLSAFVVEEAQLRSVEAVLATMLASCLAAAVTGTFLGAIVRLRLSRAPAPRGKKDSADF
jgi:serine/threonine protein kinase